MYAMYAVYVCVYVYSCMKSVYIFNLEMMVTTALSVIPFALNRIASCQSRRCNASVSSLCSTVCVPKKQNMAANRGEAANLKDTRKELFLYH